MDETYSAQFTLGPNEGGKEKMNHRENMGGAVEKKKRDVFLSTNKS